MKVIEMKFDIFRVLFILIFCIASVAAKDASDDRKNLKTNNFLEIFRDIRMIQDVIQFLPLLKNGSNFKTISLIKIENGKVKAETGYFYNVDSQKFERDKNIPMEAIGMFWRGEIKTFSLEKTKDAVNRFDYNVKIKASNPSPDQEEGMIYSPYIFSLFRDELILGEIPKVNAKGILTEFPKTYIFPIPWSEQILHVIKNRDLLSNPAEHFDDSSFAIAVRTTLDKLPLSSTEVLALIEKGDIYARAIVIRKACLENVLSYKDLKSCIHQSRSLEFVYGIALGVFSSKIDCPISEDLRQLIFAIREFYSNYPQDPRAIQVLEWIKDL